MARKQEQEPADPRIAEVAPGVLRMQLDIRIPGLGHVNCYALLDDEGVAVVDPGMPGSGTYDNIVDRLKQADLRVKDIHTVVITHSHPDHFGGAARLAKESGAKIVAHSHFSFGPMQTAHPDEPEVSVEDLASQHEEMRDSVEGDATPSDEHAQCRAAVSSYTPSDTGRRSPITPWGGEGPRPPFRTRVRWQAMRLMGRAGFVPTITHPVAEGDALRLAGRDWFVVHTPGHTEDHICLHDPEAKILLAGDHVLPTITPHISGLSNRIDPLNAFFDSLDLVSALPDIETALPAHGHPFSDLAGRAQDIKLHHHDRLERIREIGRELGPATVAQISHRLFRKQSWGAMAESETYAHLEHLRLIGDAECHENGRKKLVYATG